MIKHVYLILQQALASGVPDVKLIDMDFGQYNQKREDAVRTTPAIYIRLIDPVWQTMPKGIQRAVLTFNITLVSVTTYGDERDILDEINHAHMINHDLIYKTLQTKRYMLSTIPGFAPIADTYDDRQMIETITRKNTKMPYTLNNLLITQQTFEAIVYDYSASPIWTPVLAQLDLFVFIVKYLDEPVIIYDKQWTYQGIMTVGETPDDLAHRGYNRDSSDGEYWFGAMAPSFDFYIPKGSSSYIKYEMGGPGILGVSALVKEIWIGDLHLTENQGTFMGNYTEFRLGFDPFGPAGSLIEIKLLTHDLIIERPDEEAVYDYFMSIIENEDLPYGYRKRHYQIFQDLFQDKDLFITEYINSNGFKVRRHVTHMDREKEHNLEIAIFLCDTYGVNVDLLEKGNTPNRRYVDSRINDQVIVEFKGKETLQFNGGTHGFSERDYNPLRTARYQHKYSKHHQLPLFVFMENRGGVTHGYFLFMMARYWEQHSYIKGIYVKTDDQCDLLEPAFVNP